MENSEVEKWIEQLRKYLPGKSREELEDLFVYWERIKAEWEKLKQEFRENHSRENFLKSLEWYNERMEEHREYLDKMSGLERERFIKEYLYDKIIYSWKVDDSNKYEVKKLYYNEKIWLDQWIKEAKNQFQPWMTINLGGNKIWAEWAEKLAKEWKESLQPWMTIDLYDNNIWAEWAEKLAREWKSSLQPWMAIELFWNAIWPNWVEKLAKEWKESLQPWITIDLQNNEIWAEWIEKLAKEWKSCLQPWMIIDLSRNKIWDDWAQAIMDNIELKNWIVLKLHVNDISDYMKEKLKTREKENQDKWIKCKILVDLNEI